ncbi:MAG: ABC transporter ATP-binding protein, partial [Desulfobacteraceae bacterium]|nr:ABC transporter ATP-binding protein [Desulfobacteraceae bacterium]
MKIEIEKVSKIYNKSKKENHPVLKDITFSIEPGDFVIILGESGCGKTTLLNLLAGLERPTSGKILVDGNQIRGIHPSRSLLFQQPALIPWLSVQENVAYGCKLRGDTDKLDYRVHQFLEIMGIAGFAEALPSQLSLGMAQRVCLARALVGHPHVLLLDEPFASLDTFTQAHIQEELVNIWLSEQFTAVFVTHDIDEAIRLG